MAYREKVSATVTRITGRNPALAAWPVNSVFLGYTSTSPATLLGGGTWVQIAQGQMLVGQNPADVDFDTVGDTGGEKSHVLTNTELPTHQHNAVTPDGTLLANTSGAGHNHNMGFQYAQTTTATGSAYRVTDIQNAAGGGGTAGTAVVSSSGSSHQHDVQGHTASSAGGGLGHNNMPPYLTVYMWRRTA
jgi:microcystin-dependent protein